MIRQHFYFVILTVIYEYFNNYYSWLFYLFMWSVHFHTQLRINFVEMTIVLVYWDWVKQLNWLKLRNHSVNCLKFIILIRCRMRIAPIITAKSFKLMKYCLMRRLEQLMRIIYQIPIEVNSIIITNITRQFITLNTIPILLWVVRYFYSHWSNM